ncbi:thiol peroxidase (plasmid) [Vibrio tubiashii]|uniref:thiol peroxidase n=1 Tax=Vibrio tubiashii TaxID=29498 RepID=UPI00234F15B5|nr:thiol peroxidase [Vibrio tubiashii]WCP70374.1 thiol peroxidase [Vibrio tubiashii]
MLVTFLGNPVQLAGEFVTAGQMAPNFTLCDKELNDFGLERFKGKRIILNIFPSVDTPTCANSVRAFNTVADSLQGAEVVCVSADLPFALARFVDEEKLSNVVIASCFRSPTFAADYGVALSEGALRGLTSRAVVVLDEESHILHAELVKEISEEPDYSAAVRAIQG